MQNANKTRGTGPLAQAGVVANWGGPSLIKSVQRLSVGTVDVTITAVDTASTVIVWGGVNGTYSGGASGNEVNKRVTLLNSTTVRPTNTVTRGTVTAIVVVIEFVPGVIKSVQYGATTITAPSQTGTSSITAVNINKAMLLFLGTQSDCGSGAALAYGFANLAINSSGDTVTATQGAGAAPGNTYTGFCMVEFF